MRETVCVSPFPLNIPLIISLIQLNYHLYTPAIPPAFTPSSTDSHFVPPSSDLRQLLQSRSETIRGMPPIGETSTF